MENATKENINLIFGLKVKELRTARNYSLQELSEKSGISVSYLNEIEKGKKYPKTEKISDLAKALEVPYDQLVSLKLGKTLSPVGQILNLDILNELPFETFGIDRNLLTGIIANAPLKIAALVNTLYEIARNYNLKQEHFYFAALRSYQELNDNYFDDIEFAAERFKNEFSFHCEPPVSTTLYVQMLQEKFGYKISATNFDGYEPLKNFRSIFIRDTKKTKEETKNHLLFFNGKLTDQQRTFLFGRELGFSFLELEKRPSTTPWLKVESFDHVLNNFKASYFAQCLHINALLFKNDIEALFNEPEWSEDLILKLLEKYQASPEMLFQRITNLLPKFFGINELFFIRYSSKKPEKHLKEISKELHLSRHKENFEARQAEQHFQRWITASIINFLKEKNSTGSAENIAESKNSEVLALIASHPDGNDYFVISILRPMPELNNNSNSVTIGFQITDALKKRIAFLNDKKLRENGALLGTYQFNSAEVNMLEEKQKVIEAFNAFVEKQNSI
ncbi:MAG: helix-turn-helix transcriptional regulator [Chitinophagales bacterium]|nr:helix-turn-helix transcriptional regulator [Chitinophagales bacterium]OJV29831.1 MAG: hypothetical protein BGO32_11830 [Bacteroidetes bacterium 37-13]HRP38979.1 helix-turn-helix transcriptional regulator [Chitinophagales bacterium]